MFGKRSLKDALKYKIPFDKVLPVELREIKQRWQAIYGANRNSVGDEPTVENNLVGVGFSGGGIRSATINMGLAQSLHRHGALEHVDYVSTVSGGGYLGSSVSTLMRNNKGRNKGEFPYALAEGATESEYLTWVRNHSNYMAERGFLDYMRIVAVLVRGIILNFLTLLPYLLLFGLLLAVMYGGALQEWDGFKEVFLTKKVDSGWLAIFQGGPLKTVAPFVFTPWVVALALFNIFMYPIVIKLFKVLTAEKSAAEGSESSVKQRDAYERVFGGSLVAIIGIVLIEILPILIHWFHRARDIDLRELGALAAGGGSVIALSAAGKLMSLVKKATKLKRALLMLAIGLLGLLLPLLVVFYVTEWLVFSSGGFQYDWKQLAVIPTVLGVGLVLALLFRWWKMGFKGSGWLLRLFGFLVVMVAAIWLTRSLVPDLAAFFIAALAVEIGLFCWLALDVNLTSVHGLYRDRLASAYLVGDDTDHLSVDIEDDVNLTELCDWDNGSKSPYHIVNVAHNLQSSKDPGLRERNSDFFIFSKKYIGGQRTGYCKTEDLEAVFPQMDLATAMAISAAAASPNMGRGTSAPLVAIMTLLNVRLGYWIPNPWRLNEWAKNEPREEDGSLKQTLPRRFKWRIRSGAFLKEMWSSLDEMGKWVNLSDGGHLENLATMELLRRRCRFIITGDGEADPALHFGGLAALIQFARIDLGIDIEIKVDDLHLVDGKSGKHCALARVRYPKRPSEQRKEEGWLLYVKSSFTGDEDEVIQHYRSSHEDFPHESTADQFFDEGQLEAYRSLGQHIGDGLFESENGTDVQVSDFSDFVTWFKGLANSKNVANL